MTPNFFPRLLAFTILGLIVTIPPLYAADDHDWPGFRGTGDSNASAEESLPLTWSESENLAWRATLAGFGQSSPIVRNGHVYVTSTGGANKERLFVEAFDLADGKLIWRKEFAATQTAPEVSEMISRGAPTPVADAFGVHAFFESGDLISLEHATGDLRWERHLTKEYGEFQGGHGIGSSPASAPGSIILLVDHEGPSYLLSIDAETGMNRWKTDREPRVSWSSPLVLPERNRILLSSNGVVEGYNLDEGERLWWIDGVEGNTVASPSVDGDLVVIGSSDPRNSLAVRLGGNGDVGESHLAWRAQSVTCSFASPLLHEDMAFFVNRAGVLQATALADGSLRWETRLPDGCWATPIASGERLWFFGKNGRTAVLEAGNDGPEMLAENALPVPDGDRVYGVAASSGRFVIRTSTEIFVVGAPD